jgi:DMSO/TMAO reductase YedYZ molybdopterin-dependent catalytic subunit
MTPADTTSDLPARGRGVTVLGTTGERWHVTALRTLPVVERSCTVTCASGERTTGRWTGVPVAELVLRVAAPDRTTHLRIGGGDGYRACVPVAAALDGLVAYARDDTPLARTEPYAMRFVAPGVDGARLVKAPRRVEALALDPDEDPERLERLPLGDSGYA